MADKLIVELILEPSLDKGASGGVAKASAKAGKKAGQEFEENFTKETKKSVVNLGTAFKKLGGLIAAAGIARAFSSSISAAIEQEEAVTRLNAAMKIAGDFSGRASSNFQQLASDLQKVTRFGDEAILNQIALAKSFGATNDQAGDIAKVALDLAEAFNIDLTSATRNAAKTLGGYAGELGEVIPELKELTKEQLQAGAGIELLAKQFGGTAAERVKTFGGSTQQLSNAFGDLSESFGQFVTKNTVIIKAITNTTEVLLGQAQAVGTLSREFSRLFDEDSTKPIDILNKKMFVLRRSLNNLLAKRADAKEGFLGAFKADAQALARYDGRITILKDKLKELNSERIAISEAGREINKKDAESAVMSDAQILASKQQLQAQLGVLGLNRSVQLIEQQEAREAILAQARESEIINETEFLDRKRILQEEFTTAMQAEEDKRTMAAEANVANVSASLKVLAKNMKTTSGQLAKTLSDLAINGFGKAFQSIGAALAKGENAGQAFLDGMKGIVADIASAFGDFYIKKGIALAVDPATASLGAAVIAAGAGLKVLSGALGASGGSSSSSSSSGGGGGIAAEAAETTEETGILDEQEVAKEKTNVQLVVNGDVFNNEETGRTLLDVFNDNFDNTGASLTNTRFA